MKLQKADQRGQYAVDPAQLLAQLNPQQRQAVICTEGPLLVLAGAGSGKTRVLTYRIAYLIAKGVAPQHILALTFTNKAAGEMRERVEQLLSATIRLPWIGTFHSIFARLLRQQAEKLGYTSAFTIYDEQDSRSVVREILEHLRISPKEYSPERIAALISRAKNAMISWQEFTRKVRNPVEEVAAQVYQLYEQRLRQNNAMDFDDLLLNMIHLLEHFPDVLQHYQQQFRYILVDEYQDTNAAQFRVLSLLAQSHRNLCVVGDDAQSIYGWRGADITNILEFQKHFPDATVIRLEQNYRSTQTILDAANAVIQHNRHQLKKKLWTEHQQGEPITVLEAYDERDEAEKIIGFIEDEVRKGRQYQEIAVLYRINALSQVLEESFRRRGIPYQIVSGLSFYRRKEVKDTLAYLRLLVNPQDQSSLLRVINEPNRGIGRKTLEVVRQIAAQRRQPLFTVLAEGATIDALGSRAKRAIANFVDMVRFYQQQLQQAALPEVARRYIEATGLLAYYQSKGGEEAYEREQNIQRVLDHIAEYAQQHPEATLEEYLQEMALVEALDEADMEADRVNMLTLHAAKGLEFPVVCIVAMEKSIFPLPRSYQEPRELEEERRLFYVGITRAKQKLYLSYARYRFQRGQRLPTLPSPFLQEIPEHLVQFQSDRQTATTRRFGSERKSSPPPDRSPYRTGMKVKHPVFGVGTILGKRYAGDREILVVSFRRQGIKSLVPEYARLEILRK